MGVWEAPAESDTNWADPVELQMGAEALGSAWHGPAPGRQPPVTTGVAGAEARAILRQVRNELGEEAWPPRGRTWLRGDAVLPGTAEEPFPGLEPGISFWQPGVGPLSDRDGDPARFRRGGRCPTAEVQAGVHFREVWGGVQRTGRPGTQA